MLNITVNTPGGQVLQLQLDHVPTIGERLSIQEQGSPKAVIYKVMQITTLIGDFVGIFNQTGIAIDVQ